MSWFYDKIREPICLYYLGIDKPTTLKQKILFPMARAYAVTGAFSRLYWLQLKFWGRRFLAFILGLDD